jgi:hypothetical protein
MQPDAEIEAAAQYECAPRPQNGSRSQQHVERVIARLVTRRQAPWTRNSIRDMPVKEMDANRDQD